MRTGRPTPLRKKIDAALNEQARGSIIREVAEQVFEGQREVSVYLCTEPDFIEHNHIAIAVFPCPRKAEFVGTPEEASLQADLVEQLEEFNQRAC